MNIRLSPKGFTLPSAFNTKQEDEVRTEARFSNQHLMKSLADKCFSFLKKKSLEPGSTKTTLIRTKLKRRIARISTQNIILFTRLFSPQVFYNDWPFHVVIQFQPVAKKGTWRYWNKTSSHRNISKPTFRKKKTTACSV